MKRGEGVYSTEKTCCFTGHRAAKLPWGHNEADPRCVRLKRELYSAISRLYAIGYRRFICGMALGCDMYFAEAVLELKEEHPDVFLEAAVPCPDQDSRWSRAGRERYAGLLESCDRYTLISERYTYTCMAERNSYMIAQSSLLVAVFSGERGGTFNTIREAVSLGRRIVEIEI